jgi:D-3-phosphoglycerate dehydrogenase
MPENLKQMRVLVTPTSFAKNDPALRAALEDEVGEVVYNLSGKPLASDDLARMLPGIDGYIAGLDAIDRNALATADRLKVIARYGVGVDAVELGAAVEKGILVTNTPGANSVSVAELAVGLILSLGRNIPAAATATRSGEWPRLAGVSLEGKTVGLVGFGSIGQQVARRLGGFDCTLLAYDPITPESRASALGVKLLPLEAVVAQSDFLSLHCPLSDETRHMVNSAFLEAMKPGAFLVNTARGELVDETALLEALDSGKLRGAALDVFSSQPPAKDNPLLSHPRLIATPHMGAHTDGATQAMGWMAMRDCLAVLRGEKPQFRVV